MPRARGRKRPFSSYSDHRMSSASDSRDDSFLQSGEQGDCSKGRKSTGQARRGGRSQRSQSGRSSRALPEPDHQTYHNKNLLDVDFNASSSSPILFPDLDESTIQSKKDITKKPTEIKDKVDSRFMTASSPLKKVVAISSPQKVKKDMPPTFRSQHSWPQQSTTQKQRANLSKLIASDLNMDGEEYFEPDYEEDTMITDTSKQNLKDLGMSDSGEETEIEYNDVIPDVNIDHTDTKEDQVFLMETNAVDVRQDIDHAEAEEDQTMLTPTNELDVRQQSKDSVVDLANTDDQKSCTETCLLNNDLDQVEIEKIQDSMVEANAIDDLYIEVSDEHNGEEKVTSEQVGNEDRQVAPRIVGSAMDSTTTEIVNLENTEASFHESNSENMNESTAKQIEITISSDEMLGGHTVTAEDAECKKRKKSACKEPRKYRFVKVIKVVRIPVVVRPKKGLNKSSLKKVSSLEKTEELVSEPVMPYDDSDMNLTSEAFVQTTSGTDECPESLNQDQCQDWETNVILDNYDKVPGTEVFENSNIVVSEFEHSSGENAAFSLIKSDPDEIMITTDNVNILPMLDEDGISIISDGRNSLPVADDSSWQGKSDVELNQNGGKKLKRPWRKSKQSEQQCNKSKESVIKLNRPKTLLISKSPGSKQVAWNEVKHQLLNPEGSNQDDELLEGDGSPTDMGLNCFFPTSTISTAIGGEEPGEGESVVHQLVYDEETAFPIKSDIVGEGDNLDEPCPAEEEQEYMDQIKEENFVDTNDEQLFTDSTSLQIKEECLYEEDSAFALKANAIAENSNADLTGCSAEIIPDDTSIDCSDDEEVLRGKETRTSVEKIDELFSEDDDDDDDLLMEIEVPDDEPSASGINSDNVPLIPSEIPESIEIPKPKIPKLTDIPQCEIAKSSAFIRIEERLRMKRLQEQTTRRKEPYRSVDGSKRTDDIVEADELECRKLLMDQIKNLILCRQWKHLADVIRIQGSGKRTSHSCLVIADTVSDLALTVDAPSIKECFEGILHALVPSEENLNPAMKHYIGMLGLRIIQQCEESGRCDEVFPVLTLILNRKIQFNRSCSTVFPAEKLVESAVKVCLELKKYQTINYMLEVLHYFRPNLKYINEDEKHDDLILQQIRCLNSVLLSVHKIPLSGICETFDLTKIAINVLKEMFSAMNRVKHHKRINLLEIFQDPATKFDIIMQSCLLNQACNEYVNVVQMLLNFSDLIDLNKLNIRQKISAAMQLNCLNAAEDLTLFASRFGILPRLPSVSKFGITVQIGLFSDMSSMEITLLLLSFFGCVISDRTPEERFAKKFFFILDIVVADKPQVCKHEVYFRLESCFKKHFNQLIGQYLQSDHMYRIKHCHIAGMDKIVNRKDEIFEDLRKYLPKMDLNTSVSHVQMKKTLLPAPNLAAGSSCSFAQGCYSLSESKLPPARKVLLNTPPVEIPTISTGDPLLNSNRTFNGQSSSFDNSNVRLLNIPSSAGDHQLNQPLDTRAVPLQSPLYCSSKPIFCPAPPPASYFRTQVDALAHQPPLQPPIHPPPAQGRMQVLNSPKHQQPSVVRPEAVIPPSNTFQPFQSFSSRQRTPVAAATARLPFSSSEQRPPFASTNSSSYSGTGRKKSRINLIFPKLGAIATETSCQLVEPTRDRLPLDVPPQMDFLPSSRASDVPSFVDFLPKRTIDSNFSPGVMNPTGFSNMVHGLKDDSWNQRQILPLKRDSPPPVNTLNFAHESQLQIPSSSQMSMACNEYDRIKSDVQNRLTFHVRQKNLRESEAETLTDFYANSFYTDLCLKTDGRVSFTDEVFEALMDYIDSQIRLKKL